jgi:hypothetical protein
MHSIYILKYYYYYYYYYYYDFNKYTLSRRAILDLMLESTYAMMLISDFPLIWRHHCTIS